MVAVCLTCGSDGFPEWLVFCKKCQACTLHRYCLDGPMIIHDDVTWFCDDCEPKKPLSLKNSTPQPCRRSHNGKLERDTIPAYLKLKNLVKRVKKNYRKRQKIMKQKELKDTSGCLYQPAITYCSSSSSHRDQNHLKRLGDNNHKEQKKFMKKHKETADISGYVSIRQELSPDFHTSNHDRIQSSKPCDQTQCIDKEQKKFTKQHKEQKRHKEQEKFMMKHKGTADISGHVIISSESSPDCHTANVNRIQCSEPCDLTQCGDNFEDTANSNKVYDSAQNSGTSLNKNLNICKLDCRGEAQPVAQPIWRGSFFISNQDLINRSAVWPKGFKGLGPTTESIALYIFPETERDEKAFDKFVCEIIFLDLAIRVEFVNAEFLVFPSTVLPTPYWRYKTKYYLWGVFRSKQAS
ncbi:hypothetical protein K1719_031430 [Acacia pycnantha]|nr:hypothetical protein K1719_031430 [Acacia pycnantha]